MVASCTWEKRPSMMQPRNSQTVRRLGGWAVSVSAARRTAQPPNRLTGFVAASIPIAKPIRLHPASRRGSPEARDRKSTRLNSSHSQISYAVFCLKKKKKNQQRLDITHNIRDDAV